MKPVRFLLIVITFFSFGFAQLQDQPDTIPLSVVPVDSNGIFSKLPADSSGSLLNHTQDQHRGLKLTKRTFDHKQQVFWGLGMMAFIAIILSSSQSWNPR